MDAIEFDWPAGAAGEVAYQVLLHSGLKKLAGGTAGSTLSMIEWLQILAPLTLATRVCLVLNLMFGMGERRVADYLGVSKGVVRTRISGAAKLLGTLPNVMTTLEPDRDYEPRKLR